MAQSTAPKHESLRRATYQDVLDAPAQKSTSHMTQRFPLVPANAPANRFGWRHDGPGPSWTTTPMRTNTCSQPNDSTIPS